MTLNQALALESQRRYALKKKVPLQAGKTRSPVFVWYSGIPKHNVYLHTL